MMTTGYDCTDLLNVVLMKPIFSVSDFVQIKGRGTRPHNFKNELTAQTIEKDNFYLIDYFAVCEYFEEKYDYKEPLRIQINQKEILTKGESVSKESADLDYTTPETDSAASGTQSELPIAVAHGNYIYIGTDFLVRDNKIEIGEDCMKVRPGSLSESF